MLGASLGPTLTGVLSAFDLRAPLLVGGVIYFSLAAHAVILMRRQAGMPLRGEAPLVEEGR